MENIIHELKKDKIYLFVLISIIILGLFLRFDDFDQNTYNNDDITTIPTGLLWFFPHSYYPGLAGQGEPAIGNYIIAKFCMLSGEDFSAVTKIQPMFYPGRMALLANSLVKAQNYCNSSMYVFGIFFMMIVIVLSLSLLNKYSALFSITFFTFSPQILVFSRLIHVEIILYTFIALALFFIWKAYSIEKDNKRELIYFVFSFLFFGFAFGTKLPAIMYIFFSIFILFEKYKKETISAIKKILIKIGFELKGTEDIKIGKNLIKILLFSGIAYLSALLISFEGNLKNIFLVFSKYRTHGLDISGFGLNKGFFLNIINYLTYTNILDMLVFIFSIYIFIKIILKKNREKQENFILYLIILLTLPLLLTRILILVRVFVSFSFGLIFLASLIFSEKEYSINNILKIKNKKIIPLIFITVYILLSFSLALKTSPHFETRNPIVCSKSESGCNIDKQLIGYSGKLIGEELKKILSENETFITPAHYNFYIRPEDDYYHHMFWTSFEKQTGKIPTIQDYINYYKPNGRNVRYILINPYESYDTENYESDNKVLKENYKPNLIIKNKDIEVLWVYDVYNLTKK